MYYTIKNLHVTMVVLSAMGFALRGWWMFSGSPLLRHRATRLLPHVVDSMLLGSAIVLAMMISQYPFAANWVTAKVGGLIAYILLGTIALKRGRTRRQRMLAWCAAASVYAWIVSVALSKNATGFFAL
ncbi:SirB2 family protein [Rhodocyclaceae bacterium SMB388]